jgi:hypothetical protein
MAEGVVSAVAVGTHRVRVELSTAPMETGLHSALNPGNWSVSRVSDGLVVEVAAVEEGSASTLWILTVGRRWQGGAAYYAGARPTGLLAADGSTEYDTPPRLSFFGVAEQMPVPALVRSPTRDLRLQALGDRRTAAGTFAMSSRGDYALWDGRDMRESDYLRRLQCPRGGFLHAPGYGLGMQPKRLFSVAHLVESKREIEVQMRREPGVVGVAPRLQKLGNGVLSVGLRVALATGGVIESQALIE